MANELTVIESSELVRCENVIRTQMRSFIEVGQALAAIRDGRLYRASHKTFEAYCQKTWEFTRRRANQLIEACEAGNVLGTIVPKTNEGHTRDP